MKFQALADSIPLMVWTAQPNGEVDYYNQQWESYTGYTTAQTKDCGWAPILHPDDLEPCLATWKHALATGAPYEIEYRFKRAADGSYRRHLGRITPLKDAQDNIIKWFGISTDIDHHMNATTLLSQAYADVAQGATERTDAVEALQQETVRRIATEEALREHELRTRMILESAYDAFIAMNAEGIITDWNQQAEITFGWSRSQAIGAVLSELIVPSIFRSEHNADMQQFIASAHGEVLSKRIELTGLRKNREEFPLEVTLRALPHKDGYEVFAFLRDITEQQTTAQRLFQLTYHDYLTNLPNRSLFNDRLSAAMERSKRTGSVMALMSLDVDHFKQINDNYGHAVGDGLLIEFAARLLASVRASDTVARLGGDEFMIIAEVLHHQDDIAALAQKIIYNAQQVMPIHQFNLHITTSIGISLYQGEDINPDQLINNADRALYRAKQAGRNGMSL